MAVGSRRARPRGGLLAGRRSRAQQRRRPPADRVLEPDLFPNRLRQLVEAALTGRLADVAAVVLPRTSDPDYKCFLYLRELVRRGMASQRCRPSCCSICCIRTAPTRSAYNTERARALSALLANLAGRQHRAQDDLRREIASANRARAAARRLNALRTAAPRIAGADALPLLGAFWQLEPERYAALADAAADSLAGRPPLDGPRVLLAGAPVDSTALHAAIEAERRRRRCRAEPVRQRRRRRRRRSSRTTPSLRSLSITGASRSTRACRSATLMQQARRGAQRRRTPSSSRCRPTTRASAGTIRACASCSRGARFHTPCSQAIPRSARRPRTASASERCSRAAARAPGGPLWLRSSFSRRSRRRRFRSSGSAICVGASSTSAGRTRSFRPTCLSSCSICSRSPPSAISGGRRSSPRSAKRRRFSMR